MSNVATLGFEFSDGDAGKKVKALVESFDKLVKNKDSVQAAFTAISNLNLSGLADLGKVATSLKQLSQVKPVNEKVTQNLTALSFALRNFPNTDNIIKPIQPIPANVPASIKDLSAAILRIKVPKRAVDGLKNLAASLKLVSSVPGTGASNIAAIATSLSGFQNIRKNTVDNVRNIFTVIANMKPIPAAVLASVRTLTDLFRVMAAASASATAATRTFTGGMGNLRSAAFSTANGFQVLNGALLSVQGALSLRYLANATRQSVELGVELAQIASIAPMLNTSAIRSGLLEFGGLLGAPAENAQALYKAYSSGIRGTEKEFLQFTKIAAKTALTTRASLLPMVDAMTAAMNAYGMGVGEAGDVADNFYSIIKYGKASGEQLANSFGQVSPTAKTLGLTMNELGAAIASLTKVQPTRVAITGLNNMLSKILKPTKEAQLAMRKLGVDISYNAVQTKGFTTVMKEVYTALNGNREAIKNIFPDIRGQRAAMQLLGAGWHDFNVQLQNFANKKGAMEEAMKALENNIDYQLAKLPQTISNINTQIGSMLVNIATFGGALAPLVKSFNTMGESGQKFFGVIGAVVAGFVTYKTALFAINTVKAAYIRNNEILKKQEKELATLEMARAASKTSRESLIAMQSQTSALIARDRVELGLIRSQKMHAKMESDLALAMGDHNRAIQFQTEYLRLNSLEAQKNAQIKANSAALANAKTLQSGGTISMDAFKSSFGFMGGTGSKLGDIARDIQYQKDMALAQAMQSAEAQRAAAANGEYAASLKYAREAKASYNQALRLNNDLIKIHSRALQVANRQMKAHNATTKLSALGYKTLATSLRVATIAGYGLTKALRFVAAGIKAVWTALWPMLAITAALEALTYVWEKIDPTGSGALQQQTETISKLEETYSNLAIQQDEAIEKNKENYRSVTDAAKAMSQIVTWGKLSNAEYSSSVILAKKINDYLGYQAVSYDDANKKISFQGDLLDLIAKKSKENIKLAQQTKIVNAQEQLRKLQDMMLNAQLDAQGFWAYFFGDEYKRAVKDAEKAVAKAEQELQRVKEEAKQANSEEAKQFSQSVANVGKLQEKLAQLKRQAFMDTLTDVGKIDYLNDDIADLTANIKEYQRAITAGVPLQDNVAWEERIAQAQLDVFKKKQEILKLNNAIQKQNRTMLDEINAFQFSVKMDNASLFGGAAKVLTEQMTYFQDRVNNALKEGDYQTALKEHNNLFNVQKKSIDNQKSLAQAEKQANDATVKMILSMDKFKSSAVNAVSANSLEAIRLMSREFSSLPNLTQNTTQQDKLSAMQKSLAESALSATGPMEQLRQKILNLGTTAQSLFNEYAGTGTGVRTNMNGVFTQKVQEYQKIQPQMPPVNMKTVTQSAKTMESALNNTGKAVSGIGNDVRAMRSGIDKMANREQITITAVRV